MQIISPAQVHPVIVIGSGASGGMAAWNLTQKGIDVLLLDAGDKFDRAKYWTHVQPWETRDREARGEKPPQFFLDTKEQPYVTPDGRKLIFTWAAGGREEPDVRVIDVDTGETLVEGVPHKRPMNFAWLRARAARASARSPSSTSGTISSGASAGMPDGLATTTSPAPANWLT